MIIHQPEVVSRDGQTVVFARIELEKPQEGFPEYVWYRVPDRYADCIPIRSDAFLVSGILPGMSFGEKIEVRGPVSPRLVYHLDEYQYLLGVIFPNYLHIVDVKFSQVEEPAAVPRGVGATFSGGVDSLFTLWKHLPGNQKNPEFQITHCLFLHGFDIGHRREEKYRQLFSHFQKSLGEKNIELIPLETNLVSTLIPRIFFRLFYSPILASSAHLLGGLFRIFYIPSSRDYHQSKRLTHGSTPLTDHFLSNETLEIIHHGASCSRVSKIEEISAWEVAHRNLRVCTNPEIIWNCSRCEKCTRTMIPLYALDKLADFDTFDQPFKKDSDILWWARKFNPTYRFIAELFPFAKLNKPRIFPWLLIAAFFGYIRFWLVTYLPNPIKGWLKKYGYYSWRYEEPVSYEVLGISQSKRGLNDHPSS